MNRRLFRVIELIIVIIIVIIGVISFDKFKSLVNEKHIDDYEWLKNNVELVKSGGIYVVDKDNSINIYSDNYRKVISEKINDKLNKSYTLNEPFILYNAYGTNSQSVNMYFSTKEKYNVKYTISVDDEEIDDFSRVLNGNLTSKHAYQIIGLVPGYLNNIKIELLDENNNVSKKYNFEVDLVDQKTKSQAKLKVTESVDDSSLYEGLYTILGNDSNTGNYLAMYDNGGILRSEIPIMNYRANKILFKDNFMYFSISSKKIVKMNNLGEVVDIYSTKNYKINYDYAFDNNGNLLVIASDSKKSTVEDQIIRIDTNTHEVTNLVDFSNLFSDYIDFCKDSPDTIKDINSNGLNYLGLNSIEYIDNSILVSSRETSSIIKVDNIDNDPKISYIIGAKELWKDTNYYDLVFEKKGEFIINAGQSDCRYNGQYITMFNNNYANQASYSINKDVYKDLGITNTDAVTGTKSMFYKYKIDEVNKNFELVDSFIVSYSGINGNSQVLPNGNILIDSAVNGKFIEYDSNHNVIKSFKVKLNKDQVYRVYKYTFNDYWFK